MALHALRDGNQDALDILWERYFPRLVRLARSTLYHLPHRTEDADDAAQSAFISFWNKAERDGLATLIDRNSLWSLLATITVRKARRVIRHENTQKRGAGQIVREIDLVGTYGRRGLLDQVLTAVPAQDFDIECEERLNGLSDDLRQFAVLRLFGHTNREIAEILDCTERKVERKLNLIRQHWSLNDHNA